MNPLAIDHLAVAGKTLEAAVAHVERSLGIEMSPGGRHAGMATHNRLLSLGDGIYLEAIAPDPAAQPPARPRWFGLDKHDGPPRLVAWVLRGGDPSAVPGALGTPLAMTRGDLAWQLTVRDDGALPWGGACPLHILWSGNGHPAERLADSDCRLAALRVTHPRAEEMREAWPALGAVGRLQLSRGPEPNMRAEIETPHGTRTLT